MILFGVLEHDNNMMSFYRSFHNVSKNFTVYCISKQIEKWRFEFDRYPAEIFIQMDGGPEGVFDFEHESGFLNAATNLTALISSILRNLQSGILRPRQAARFG